MLTVSNATILESEEFNELNLLDEWFKYTWGDEHDPVVEDIIEYEEDYFEEDINRPKELSRTEV